MLPAWRRACGRQGRQVGHQIPSCTTIKQGIGFISPPATYFLSGQKVDKKALREFKLAPTSSGLKHKFAKKTSFKDLI